MFEEMKIRYSQSLRVALVLAVSTLALVGCKSASDLAMDAKRIFTTTTGKTITVAETHPVGQSLSTIKVTTDGFEHDLSETFENLDPVSEIFIADLDSNGFDEIYIVTQAAGSGSYGRVIGFASNFDKSLSMINLPDLIDVDSTLAGEYMGHDSFTIENNRLVRSFPIYDLNDPNSSPALGTRRLVYGLYAGEATWQLRIEESEVVQ